MSLIVLILLLPSLCLRLYEFLRCKSLHFLSPLTNILLLCFCLPVSILIKRPHGQKDMCMRVSKNHVFLIRYRTVMLIYRNPLLILYGRIMEVDISNHPIRDKRIPDIFLYQPDIFLH